MKLIRIYECMCDPTRLRLLHLLTHGPLCVCHFQTILGEPQVKVSKHLGYLKRHGLVEVRREGNWRIYRLVAKAPPALQRNLACLQDCIREEPRFQRDLARLQRLQAKDDERGPSCCAKPSGAKARAPAGAK